MTKLAHEVKATPGGSVRVRLSLPERDALRALAQELRPIVAGGPPSAGEAQPSQLVRGRLYPRAYEDPLDQLEYGELNSRSLTDARTAALDRWRASLDGGRVRGRQWSVELAADEAAAWLSAVNDGRLVLAEIVGIGEEDDWEGARDSHDGSAVMLHYLGLLEEELVEALAHTL